MTVAIIQARMGSTRLPGKVLKDIQGKTLLQNLVDRIRPAQKLDAIIIATTTNAEDDPIEEYCKKHEIQCFRGSDWDVLDRFYQAALSLEGAPKTIVRICCDNPLHSHKVVDFVVGEFEQSGKTYFSNSNQEPDYLEDGFDVEVFTFDALKSAWKDAKLLSEREHVCPFIKRNFSCGWKKAHPEYDFKLSVDTQADLDAVRKIFSELSHDPDFGIDEVVDLLQRKPEILDLNASSEINSGYKKSLDNDEIVK
ncbi:MAG: glycosyltransferase family protein [Flavobacteriales bacterium]|nr:glycosyltransferase family protein [Flavobacteriales bacterium]